MCGDTCLTQIGLYFSDRLNMFNSYVPFRSLRERNLADDMFTVEVPFGLRNN